VRRVGFAPALAVGGVLLVGCAAPASPPVGSPDASSGIVAHGEGTVTGTPDTLTLVLGVQTQAPQARAALDANNARAGALVALLKARGVAAKDLRTSELSITPVYGPGLRQFAGYQVINQVTATMHGDLVAAGGIIDAAAGAAGDTVRVQQVSFSINDDGALRDQARAAAVKQAMAHARQMANAAGVSLGALRSITEVAPASPVPYTPRLSPRTAPGAEAPVEPGSQQLRVAVDVVYDIG
jgi:uncharacterized protein YggE